MVSTVQRDLIWCSQKPCELHSLVIPTGQWGTLWLRELAQPGMELEFRLKAGRRTWARGLDGGEAA